MDRITYEVRLEQWKQIAEQCQNRPVSQTAKDWLENHGINPKRYYYWLRKIRKQVYEQSVTNAPQPKLDNFPAAPAPDTISFAEIPFPLAGEASEESTFQPAAVVQIGNASIAFSNAATTELLSKIIQEVSRHA